MTRKSRLPDPVATGVIDVDLADELEESFLTYALTVIVARAIPDARDGMKPAQRRVLYAMWNAGITPDKPHRKSVAAVSETMKSFHPYGDAAIYDTLARMAQPWVLPVLLVDGHGNFGGLDDTPAAQRYTEARLTPAAMELLAEVATDAVDMRENFDATTTEPVVLPAAWPALLVNGASGIAVGMATSVPTHNLGEVAAAVAVRIANPRCSVDDVLKVCPGPDFPGGGVVADPSPLPDIYRTGRGSVRLRARVAVDTSGRTPQLVVTELPYQVGPEKVVARVRDLVADGRLPGVGGIEDMTDRTAGLRLVVDVNAGHDPADVAAELFRLTPMEETVSFNMVALVDGAPATCSLLSLLDAFIDHRIEVVQRRSAFLLAKATRRLAVVEALLAALDHLDEIIAIVRSTRKAATARTKVAKLLRISLDAADAVLDLPLRRLGALERSKLTDERRQLRATIAELKRLLRSPKAVRATVADELVETAGRYATPRRTTLGAQAVTAAVTGLRFDAGRVVTHPDGHSPAVGVTSDGRAVPLDPAAVDNTDSDVVGVVRPGSDMVVVTANGNVKRVVADATAKVRAGGRQIIRVGATDQVVSAFDVAGDVVMVASSGRALRFDVDELTARQASSGPVAGMKLSPGDRIVAATSTGSGMCVSVLPPRARTPRLVQPDEVVRRRRGGVGVWLTGKKETLRGITVTSGR